MLEYITLRNESLAIVVKGKPCDAILSKARENRATAHKLHLVTQSIARSNCHQAAPNLIS